MFNIKMKGLGIIAGLSLSLVVAGCGQEETGATNSEDDTTTNISEQMDYTITGIEPGAGQTGNTDIAIEEYESLSGWTQESASTAAMLTELDAAIENKEPIVVTAWSPHYKFAKYDIKYLDDPKGVFGELESATTITRKGLKEDMPGAHTILDRMNFELEDIESALLEATEIDFDYEQLARQWVDENQETVAEWTDRVEPVDGTPIEIGATLWDDMLFTGNIASVILEQHGFDVTFTSVDPAILFEAIVAGDVDASLSPWFPATHGALYEQYEGQFEDLGGNMVEGRIGLAVPTYMDIDSIEDLEPKE